MSIKKLRRRILPLLAVVLCLIMSVVPVMAEDEIDLGRAGSVSVGIRAYATDEAVGGGSLNLYRIADIGEDNEYFYYTYTEDFAGCSDDLLGEDRITQAETVNVFSELADSNNVEAAETVSVSAEGKAYFDDLSCGVYMVTQNEKAEGYNGINAFIVTVPLNEDGVWIYDVDATPKTIPVEKNEETDIEDTGVGQREETSFEKAGGVDRTVKTGDVTHASIYLSMVVLAAFAVILAAVKRRNAE